MNDFDKAHHLQALQKVVGGLNYQNGRTSTSLLMLRFSIMERMREVETGELKEEKADDNGASSQRRSEPTGSDDKSR